MIRDIIEPNTQGLTQVPGRYFFFAPGRGEGYSTQVLDVRNNKLETANYYSLMLSDGTPGVAMRDTIARPEGWEKFKLVGLSFDSEKGPNGENVVDGGFEYKGQRHFGRITEESLRQQERPGDIPVETMKTPEEQQAETLHKNLVHEKKEQEKRMRLHFGEKSKYQKPDTRGHGGNRHKGGHRHQRHGR